MRERYRSGRVEGKNEGKEEKSRERGGGRKVCWGIEGLGKGNKKGRGGRERRNILHEQRKHIRQKTERERGVERKDGESERQK